MGGGSESSDIDMNIGPWTGGVIFNFNDDDGTVASTTETSTSLSLAIQFLSLSGA